MTFFHEWVRLGYGLRVMCVARLPPWRLWAGLIGCRGVGLMCIGGVRVKIIEASYTIERLPDADEVLRNLERAARTCYKSEGKIRGGSAERLIASIVKRGHLSVIEHESATVRFVCDRAVANELTRHRLASFSQESTRYVDYEDGVTFIRPHWSAPYPRLPTPFEKALKQAESSYEGLRYLGVPPEGARAVLPLCTKTELVMTANLREWRHVFALRTNKAAHPDMRALMAPLAADFAAWCPVLFGEFGKENK